MVFLWGLMAVLDAVTGINGLIGIGLHAIIGIVGMSLLMRVWWPG